MSERHLAREDVLRFARGEASRDEVEQIVDHLGDCLRCAAMARSSEGVDRASSGVAAWLADHDDEHPTVETTLTAYVDGTLEPNESDGVRAHLEDCPRCRADVSDLRATAAVLRRPRHRNWAPLAAAAAAIVIALVAIALRREPAPAPPVVVTNPAPPPAPAPQPAPAASQPEYARAEWRAAVNEALRTGALAMPAALAELQFRPDPRRAPAETGTQRLDPAGVILDDTRPRFSWTPVAGARYVMSVFDDHELVMESDVLREPRWRPSRPLRRGRTYHWQVEVRRGETATIIPAPPAPPAYVRVLDGKASEELEAARRAHGDDALLLGVLYARHGLRAEAERALAGVHSDEARRLLGSVRAWPVQRSAP